MSSELLSIECFVDGNFGENAFVIHTAQAEGSAVGWVIDPSFSPQVDKLLDYARQQTIAIEKIILTHGHLDHIAGVDAVRRAFPEARILMAEVEQSTLSDAEKNLSASFGVPMTVDSRADEDIEHGAEFRSGPYVWTILDTSGHSPGGRSIYCAEVGVVFTGDALFAGSIGRTDLAGSDPARLIRLIRENLLTLPDQTVVYPGHGDRTTIGNERKSNPFLSDV